MFLITCVLFVAYLGGASLRPAGIFWSLDEGGKYLYLQNVIRTGDFSAPFEYPGRYLDAELRFVPLVYSSRQDSNIYSWWPTGFPAVSLPFYQALGWLGLYVLPAGAGALCALISGLMVRRLRPHGRWLDVSAAVITGLATPIVFYSISFWEHTLSTACFLGAALCVLQAWSDQRVRWVALAGLLASLATFFRTEVAAMALGLGLVLLCLRWRWATLFGIGYALASLPWLLFNLHSMGHLLSRQWLTGPVTLNIPLFSGVQDAGVWFIPYILFNAPKIVAFPFDHATLAVAMTFLILALAMPFMGRLRWISIVAYLGLVGICAGVLLHPDGYRSVHGFVLIAPHIVFAAWLYRPRLIDAPRLFAVILFGVTAVFMAAYVARGWNAAGGLQWGPRYMLTLYPLWVVASITGLSLIGVSLKRYSRIALVVLYGIGVMIGMGYEIRGLYAAVETTRYYRQTRQAIQQLGTKPIVTRCTWLPMVIPDLYWTGSVFAVDSETRFQEWLTEARRLGLSDAYSVELDLCTLVQLDQIEAQRLVNPGGIIAEPVEIGPRR